MTVRRGRPPIGRVLTNIEAISAVATRGASGGPKHTKNGLVVVVVVAVGAGKQSAQVIWRSGGRGPVGGQKSAQITKSGGRAVPCEGEQLGRAVPCRARVTNYVAPCRARVTN